MIATNFEFEYSETRTTHPRRANFNNLINIQLDTSKDNSGATQSEPGMRENNGSLNSKHCVFALFTPGAANHSRHFTKSSRGPRCLINCPITATLRGKPSGSSSLFVPSLLLSNVMSLAPKIDEIREVVHNVNFDLVCITESWLKDHIDNNSVAISGYNVIRQDRTEAEHGGICLYVKESIRFKTLDDMADENFEILWTQLHPQHIDCGQSTPPTLQDIANEINKAFLAPMNVFEPLAADSFPRPITKECPLKVSELSVFKKMLSLNSSKAMGPDGVPGWLLKENADLFAQPVADILNCSFQEARLPSSWKDADIAPVPKEKPIRHVNKHLHPISLTPVLSKLTEDYVIEQYVKPAVLARVDANQFGTVPGSNTTVALISMLHSWLCDTDGNGATVRAILLDFRKAFDLIDHKILVRKLMTYSLPSSIITWITDFLTCRRQRVKLSQDCFSEWGSIPSGVPHGTKLGPWLFVIMIDDLSTTGNCNMWKYVDDTTISEVVQRSQNSDLQRLVDDLSR